MRTCLPPLESLRVLVACLQHGSFSRAAMQIGLTPAAVSQRMRTLEAQIGVQLFRRHGPKLTATEHARVLGRKLEHAFSLVQAAVEDCRSLRRPLRVTCAPTFAARWLVPRLAAYQRLPGAEEIVLDATQELLPAGAFDVAIRSGTGPWAPWRSLWLLPELGTPMLSPRSWPRSACKGRLAVRDLLELPWIPDPRWREWLALAGMPDARPRFVSTRFPNYELEAQAAVQGVGVALLSPVLFAGLVKEGALVAPFASVVEGPASYWLLFPEERAGSHFVRWIRSEFGIAAG
jgi:LysR family transcriptional regulator, glycine cleavage system transcriptional activator